MEHFIKLKHGSTQHDLYYYPTFQTEAYHQMEGIGSLHNPTDSISYAKIIQTGLLYDERQDSLITKSQQPANTLTLLVDTSLYTLKELNLSKPFRYNKMYSSYPRFLRLKRKRKLYRLPLTKDTSLYVTAQPVFIANTSNDLRYIVGPSRHLLVTQQAKDKNNHWKDIETNSILGCGMMRDICELKPNEFVLTSVFRFNGSFKTQLRIKLETANHIYYSEPFTGYINYEQIYNPKIKIIDGDLFERH